MKDEPWRGDPSERVKHLERKLGNKKERIRNLEADLAAATERADVASKELKDRVDECNRRCKNETRLQSERDTLRSQITAATEAMHCAVLKIQDGSPHHAEGVLSDAIARLEDEGEGDTQ